MKLIDLEATETRTKYNKVLAVGFSQKTYNKLQPYRENREAAGFVRLAVGVLLAVTGETVSFDVEPVADELVTSCKTMSDLDYLIFGLDLLVEELQERVKRIEADQ